MDEAEERNKSGVKFVEFIKCQSIDCVLHIVHCNSSV